MKTQPIDIIGRLMTAAGVKTQVSLASYLEIPPSSITDALRRGKIPEAWLYKTAYKTGRRFEHLLTGEKPEYVDRVAEAATHYKRSAYLPQLAEALEEMEEAERDTLLLCADALRRGDDQVKHHLIGQLEIIKDAVDARKSKRNKGDPAKRKRDAAG